LFLQRAQYPTEIARINPKAASQFTDLGALRSDLPKHPSLADGAVPLQKPIVQSANALGHNSVKAAHLLNSASIHLNRSLTIVRDYPTVKSSLFVLSLNSHPKIAVLS